MNDLQKTIYISKASNKGFGNEYRIFYDRIELEFILFFKLFVIPREEIETSELFSPLVIKTKF